MRDSTIGLCCDYGAEVHLVYVASSYAQLFKQNAARRYPVPEKVPRRLVDKWEVPTVDEGHVVTYQVA